MNKPYLCMDSPYTKAATVLSSEDYYNDKLIMNVNDSELFQGGMGVCIALFLHYLSQGGKQALDYIEELAQNGSIRIGNLISRILVKKYPSRADSKYEVTFDELIEWDFWPCFIRISCEKDLC